MKRLLVSLGLALVLAMASKSANAQTCVTNLYSGLVYDATCCECQSYKKMKMVIHQNNGSWVSYSIGSFRKGADGVAEATTAKQIFDEAYYWRGSPVFANQSFDVTRTDIHTVRITSAGAITIYNLTWSFTTNLTAGCSGNLITASSGWEYYLISFGAAQGLVC